MNRQRTNKNNTVTSVNAITKKMFTELSVSEKNLLKKHYSNIRPAFTINPYALQIIQKDVNNYILFIDARINSCYLKVKEHLEKNKHKISSFSSVGDADFIVEYSSTDLVHNRFKKEIYDLLETAPKEKPGEKLVESFKITKTFILKGTNNDYTQKNEYDLADDDIPKISQLQSDYTKKASIGALGGERKLKKFLHDIRDKQILLGYYIIGEPIKATIKAYVLLLYSRTGYEHILLRNKSVREKVVDFHAISIDSGDDEFYKQANFLITAEFNSILEYHVWKENLYISSKENEHQINVMTFILENVISDIPVGVGNYTLFDEVARNYNIGLNDKVFFGHPYYYEELKTQYNICINLSTLKENGFIIGEPGTGKTYTAMVLAKKFFDKQKRVHIVDCSGGISDKFNEVFPNNSLDIVKNVELSKAKESGKIFPSSHNIFFYQPEDKKEYCDLVLDMANYITKMANPNENRVTTDILILEEAHLLFRDVEVTQAILECITISGRKGFSIWFSTQKLSHLPTTLLSNLRNRIVHKVDNAEKKLVYELLLSSGEENIYDNLEKELITLEKGQAIVSFVFPKNNLDIELSPLKIKIML